MFLSIAVRQRIVNLVSNNHISLRELSRQSEVPYPTLINIMSGKSKTIKVSTLYKLCLALNIELVDFFDSSLFHHVIDEHEKQMKN